MMTKHHSTTGNMYKLVLISISLKEMGKSHETLIKQLTLKSQNMRSEWVPDRHGGIWVGTRQKHSLVVAMVKTEVVNCIQVSVRYHNCKVGWSQNEELICLKRKNDRHVVKVKKYACHSWLHKLPEFWLFCKMIDNSWIV